MKTDTREKPNVMTAIRELDKQLARRRLPLVYDDQALTLLQAADQGEGRAFDDAHDMLDRMERANALNVSMAREALGPRYLSVKGFTPYHTGGGCMALMKELPDGGYVLITDVDDAALPRGNVIEVAIGRYDSDGCVFGETATSPGMTAEVIDVTDINDWMKDNAS